MFFQALKMSATDVSEEDDLVQSLHRPKTLSKNASIAIGKTTEIISHGFPKVMLVATWLLVWKSMSFVLAFLVCT